MKKLFFLLSVILCFNFSAKAQKQQTVNVFFGYKQYFSKESHIHFPFNYSIGSNYGISLNERTKLECGFLYTTRKYFYRNIYYSSTYGFCLYLESMNVKTWSFPKIKIIHPLFQINQSTKISAFYGFETMYISSVILSTKSETIDGYVLNEYIRNISEDVKHNKQVGLNMLFGLRYNKETFENFSLALDITGSYSSRPIWYLGNAYYFSFDKSRFSIEPKICIEYIIK